MFDTVFVLLFFAGLLIVVGISQRLAAQLKLPQSVVLAAIGIGIGALPAIGSQIGFPGPIDLGVPGVFDKQPLNSAIFIYVFLPLLVFEAGAATDVKRTVQDAAPILVLAVVATLITAAAIGLALWPFAEVPLVACLLLGSIVATTDPAAVIAVFRDIGAPRRLSWLVEGEALLNDAAAIALFILLLGFIQAGREPSALAGLAEFILLFAGGGVFGYVAGQLLLWRLGLCCSRCSSMAPACVSLFGCSASTVSPPEMRPCAIGYRLCPMPRHAMPPAKSPGSTRCHKQRWNG
jgi:CPA1 family monovalent cation:H+ antiporter